MAHVRWSLIVLLPASLLLSQGSAPATPVADVDATPISETAVLVGAGDIADCGKEHDEATAELLDSIDGTIVTFGDHAYPDGTPEEFAECFDPSWGRHKDRIRPAPGNHDYITENAQGYFDYFGEAAGDPDRGYYSYDVGAWHVIALNSNCSKIEGGCDEDSPQAEWLRADLEAHPTTCTVAYWHHPRFSSAHHGNSDRVHDLWRILDEAGADIVLAGHDHTYERFAPQDADGNADDEGIREFVVGTGGKTLYEMEQPVPNSEVRNNTTFGVLKLTLHADSYEWEFIPAEGAEFTDQGSDDCV